LVERASRCQGTAPATSVTALRVAPAQPRRCMAAAAAVLRRLGTRGTEARSCGRLCRSAAEATFRCAPERANRAAQAPARALGGARCARWRAPRRSSRGPAGRPPVGPVGLSTPAARAAGALRRRPRACADRPRGLQGPQTHRAEMVRAVRQTQRRARSAFRTPG
jgi:hypothetical protein